MPVETNTNDEKKIFTLSCCPYSRLPEKHRFHFTITPNRKHTQFSIYKKRERGNSFPQRDSHRASLTIYFQPILFFTIFFLYSIPLSPCFRNSKNKRKPHFKWLSPGIDWKNKRHGRFSLLLLLRLLSSFVYGKKAASRC